MSNFNPIDNSPYRVQAPQNVLDDDDDKERKRKKEDESSSKKQYDQAKKKAQSIVEALRIPIDTPVDTKQKSLKSHETCELTDSKEKKKACDILKTDSK